MVRNTGAYIELFSKASLRSLAMAILCALSFIPQAYAVCSSPAGAAGEIVYNSSYGQLQYCNNTSWVQMGLSTCSQATIPNPDPQTTDWMATSFNGFVDAIDIDDDLIAIGVSSDNSNTGVAYVFNALDGSLISTLTNPNPTAGDRFGHAVSILGDIVVIGAPSDSSGVVYIFDSRSGTLLLTLNHPAPTTGDFFGAAVGISGNLVVVGAYGDDTDATQGGMVFVFDISTNPATLVSTTPHPTPASDAQFGWSVAIDGNYAVVGTYDVSSFNDDDVYVFDITTDPGTLVSTLNNPNFQNGNAFGRHLDIEGNLVAVTDNEVSVSGNNNAGSVYVFDITTDPATLISTMTKPSPAASDFFGRGGVDISGDRIVTGEYINEEKAYVFDITTDPGTLISSYTNTIEPQADDDFGRGVSLSGSRAVFAAPAHDVGAASDAGTAYTFCLDGTCENPAGVAGEMMYNQDYHVMQYCGREGWSSMGPLPGSGGAGCSNPAMPEGGMVYNTDFNVMQYCDGTDWVAIEGYQSSGGQCDDPNGFFFTDQTGVARNTQISSTDIRQINGISCAANVSVSGSGSPQFRICTDGSSSAACDGSIVQNWGSATQSISNGQYIQLRQTSSNLFEVATTANLTVGQDSDAWSVTTLPCDKTPNAFSFTAEVDVAKSTSFESDIVQISGIDADASCQADVVLSGDASAQYRICNDGTCSGSPAWGTASSTILNNQWVQVKVTSSASDGVTTTGTLTIDSVAGDYDVTVMPIIKTVFVATNGGGGGYTGNLGGVTGADGLCATEASNASLAGTYKAWIADGSGTNDPVNNFTGVSGLYRYMLPDGTTKVADNWADLTDGTLDNPIDQDAGGSPAAATTWTNVATDGSTTSTNVNQGACQNWASSASNRKGYYAFINSTSATWTDTGFNLGCDTFRNLYCFEQ